MSVAKVLEISSRSSESFEEAIAAGIKKAGESVRGIREAWVQDFSVRVEDDAIVQYDVNLKITFLVD